MGFELTTIDNKLISQVVLDMRGEVEPWVVKFQFPPVLKSDNKGIDYEERSMFNVEPMAIFKGSKPRSITLKWVYIVTGSKHSNNYVWNCENIAKAVKRIRGFYYQTNNAFKSKDQSIHFQCYDVIGLVTSTDGISFRSESIDISHSDTIVNDGTGVYPLKTEFSMKLKLWSNGEIREGGEIKEMIKLPWLSEVSTILQPQWR